MHNKLKLHVISHTHWDREWYQTFQGFRKRLVCLIDDLLDHMEKDENYKYFHMDGQTIVLEDYLKIRPENEKRLRTLIEQGRIIIGPWYVMPDEFLISGESLVRNLKKGFEISRSYGVEPMKSGYVIDIFGHNSQFPQVLKGFGIDSAVLYRGIGDYEKDAFNWVGADGSTVLVLKLDRDRSYSNFYFAIRWPFEGREIEKDELITRMKQLLDYSGKLAVSENRLMMDGVDHIDIEPRLHEIITILNENIEDIELIHSTIEDITNAQKNSGLELDDIKGELYNVGKQGVNNQVLKNVLSSMVHLKQMNNECETLLTKWAEPFDVAAGFIKNQSNSGFLNEAWTYLMKNHPHDSICGCSITPVHEDNEYRFRQVKNIAEEVIESELNDIAESVRTIDSGKENSIILFNGTQKDIHGIVEVDLKFPAGSQGNFKIFDMDGNEVPYQTLDIKRGIVEKVVRFRRLIDFHSKDHYKVAFKAFIPSVGYSTYAYEEYKNVPPAVGDYSFKVVHTPTRYQGSMQTGHRTWENEYLKVTIQDNGTLNVINKETCKEYKELMIFEDCADVGDGWNYRKPSNDTRYLSINGKSEFAVEYDGPMAVMWRITNYMTLPAGMSSDGMTRSAHTTEFKIVTYVKMKKDSSKLEFNTRIGNNVDEHRLRVLFPSYLNTELFSSSTPFYLQERSIKKKDFSNYVEIDTGVYPNQGIILLKDDKDLFALYNKGLYEVEITEDASHTTALTLFRSFRNEVGRSIGELSFMRKSMSFDYAVEFKGNVDASEAMVSGEEWKTGIKSAYTGSHDGKMPQRESFLKVNIPGVILSAFKNGNSGMKVIRLYNCTDAETSGSIELHEELSRVCLLNMVEEIENEVPFSGKHIKIELKPAQIMTLGVFYGGV